MATQLTEYEVISIIDQYSRIVDWSPEGFLRNRLRYEAGNTVLFTSEAWTTNFTESEREAVVHRFLTMVAYHEVAETMHEWSPAHVGYTVRMYRTSRSEYLNDKAEQIDRWARKTFDERTLAVYEAATR